MAALQAYLNIPSTSLTAATAQSVAVLTAPTNQRVKVLGYGFYFDGTLNSAQPVTVILALYRRRQLQRRDPRQGRAGTDRDHPDHRQHLEDRHDRGNVHGLQDVHRAPAARVRVHGPARSGGHHQGRHSVRTPRSASRRRRRPRLRQIRGVILGRHRQTHDRALRKRRPRLSQAGRFGMAADFFRYAIGASSSPDPCLWTGLCGVLRLSKQYPEAESAILEALALERTAQRLVALACTQRNRGRKPEAEATLREALELDPDYADALGFLGTWLIDRWRETSGPDEILMEALMYLDKAVELAPTNESFQESRLIVIQSLDLHEECLINCERLLEHYPRALPYETAAGVRIDEAARHPRGAAGPGRQHLPPARAQ